MDTLNLMSDFLVIFLLILFGYYLIPAGSAYYFFYIWKRKNWEKHHIQNRFPGKKSILREIKWSVVCVAILALLTLILYRAIQQGHTKMYSEIPEYGWGYLVFSTLFSIVAYDSYFYWLHRFMHLKWVFPIVHRTHHLSHTPSPFATLAFSPLESALEFGIVPILVFLLPMHPLALGIFVAYNIFLNTGGHLGFEIVPSRFLKLPVLKYGLTVTHHEMHHANTHCNYGIYFTFWDKWMKTNHPEYEATYQKTQTPSPK